MAKRENPRRKEREFNKLQEKQNRSERKREYLENKKNRNNGAADNRIKRNNVEFGTEEIREDLVLGRNAVIEALKSNTTIEYISVAKGDLEGSIKVVLGLAKEKNVIVKEVDRRNLDQMCGGASHQGVIAKVTPFKYSEVTDIINRAKRKGEDPFIVILDEIEDPHNLGSIIRTAELCGVHGIIIPKRRNVGVTPTVYKCSAGAIEHMRIAKVTNINATIDQLKEEGIWIYGADIDGKDFSYNTNFSGPCALVIGSEGRGISKLTLKKCDVLVKIPMIGKINSLNASVAGGIMMYEVLKGRLTK
ncbi:23S rRNA (guanosine(2251)-2'-O)-methyltransferase RlmB [Clostridium sp. NSJ-6]|uniref:23S rRNA (Guanosine(2251)-2'-O)-methyltransferase RlmB n=2 Tax=Clostridium TaxID=1485 RepID=A0ABR7DHE5_9CLOT|nr:23S rRNA (guanosine(2251)-2'-O)-methyltransferase RlmB [Clostridium hominis]MBC5630857.1 23S rRNA (guanosine(2251)-2'-O)-methyltransferase RlmB [Clostridium hominis]MDU2674244.1 23S rRNA (guanosine(2251)-2'-O)-methyltransferase RlmB [Clostridium sp.]